MISCVSFISVISQVCAPPPVYKERVLHYEVLRKR